MFDNEIAMILLKEAREAVINPDDDEEREELPPEEDDGKGPLKRRDPHRPKEEEENFLASDDPIDFLENSACRSSAGAIFQFKRPHRIPLAAVKPPMSL